MESSALGSNMTFDKDMNILLADDHGLFRDSMGMWLNQVHGNISIQTVSSLDALLKIPAGIQSFDLLLLDLYMPGMQGVQSVRTVCARAGDVPVVIVSAEESPLIMRACVDAGAAGYVPKSSKGEEILNAIHQVCNGHCYLPLAARKANSSLQLSPKQIELLSLLAKGYPNKEIAKRMFLSDGTVRQYVSIILNALGVENRTQASIRARAILGLETPADHR